MDAFDMAYVLRADLERMLDVLLDLLMMTDSKQLFDSVTCGKHTTERRLSIDISAARQSYRNFEIHSIGLIRGEANPADSLTKVNGNDALKRVMDSGCDFTPVVQWVEREFVQSNGNDGPGGSVEVTRDRAGLAGLAGLDS